MKSNHPSARELQEKAQGLLYSLEARESDGNLVLRRAANIEVSRLFLKGRTQKRAVNNKNKSGHLTEHIAALEDRPLAVEIL